MTEREALEQLLEALDKELPHNMKHIAAGQRFNARAALAQPEQEPVIGTKTWFEDGKVVTQHLTAKDIYKDPEQPEQEPVATISVRWHEPVGKVAFVLEVDLPVGIHKVYTTPPQRTWVGLTDEEVEQGLLRSDYALQTAHAWRAGVVFAIAKLKEKNNA